MDSRTVAQKSSSPLSSSSNGFQAIIMALILTVTIGYFLLLIVTPTNMYRQIWTPMIKAQTATSTYFGAQGRTLLMNTFPFIFIAVLGCVYLHLWKKSNDKNINRFEGKQKLTIWRRPIIMKGLGIVSRIELCFFVMFIALLVWTFASYLHIIFPTITPKSVAKSGEKVWEAKLEDSALRLGLVGNIALTFLFVPVTRGSSVLQVFGLTSEASVKYHIWLGHIVMTLFSAHGICYIIYWAATHQLSSEMLKWAKTDISNLAGELSLLSGLVLWIATFPRIRRKMFELFFYTHHLYILFVVFFVFHVGVSYAGIMLPGFFLFMVDRYLRFLQSRSNVRLVSARVLPCETVELNFSKSKDLSYTPTSIMFVNVPSISKMQWHPFTITSSSSLEADKLSVVIKGEGSWSKKLYQMLSSPISVDRLNVSVEGPYGPPSTHFLRHDLLVMVSGGSGITPFISIVRELIHTSESQKCKTPEILLISVFKNSEDLTMLDLLLPISGAPSETSKLGLQIEAYVTREKQPILAQDKKNLRAIWFKPDPSDQPITPILGQNNWLWLGAIISSSFIIFLISLGALNRYYIYPIDNNTNDIYSYPIKAVLNMLLICISIVITSTAAFLWNKRHTGADAKQIQNMEGATPTSSPNSWFYNADREMESLPQQSLVQSTNLHFGEKPDLKRILFERKESSVGVLVCGPKKMRHEVANICSSGLASNLHFESISFSW
ncbi:PREDICTED: ferric reduction oxidase 2 [Nicotiana attenuata]|uniref:ferric-chelate reductase (NADH) n=1 Tax=Nicotiana attenuata TaxID=49451 RepID=A0A1J6JEF1_NICAT|nr:PREDICTED: ferric reduction oxidase 2 [Nicotiana attenuata]OIT08055.1 ferric reduction oxidase 2 [Nicotiana attenuata]